MNINAKMMARELSPLLDCIRNDIGIEMDNVAPAVTVVLMIACHTKVTLFLNMLAL
ncbi:hypothetical protein GQN28_26560 [Escherichia coli]|nr:hypothetical protein [Escherichia coli]